MTTPKTVYPGGTIVSATDPAAGGNIRPHAFWFDPDVNVLQMRNTGNTAWVPVIEDVMIFEASGSFPPAVTNAAAAYRFAYPITIISVELVVGNNGTAGSTEMDLLAGDPDAAPASVLTTLPAVLGDAGVWGVSGVTTGSTAAVINTASHAAGKIFSADITDGATGAESATLVVRYVHG